MVLTIYNTAVMWLTRYHSETTPTVSLYSKMQAGSHVSDIDRSDLTDNQPQVKYLETERPWIKVI